MLTMADNVIAAGDDIRPPMLEKSLYNSWQSLEENGVTRPRTYDELTDKEKLRDECDIRATNIVLQGLPPDVYNLVNHHTVAKEIWDRFTLEKGESIHVYYLRFAQLINDMNTIGMTMQKLQVNTKFVNNLQPEGRKFVTDVKLARDMHESNFDQLYAYLRQHEAHANEVHLMRERFPDPLALVANYHYAPSYYTNHQPQYTPSQFHQHHSPIDQELYNSHQQPQSYDVPAVEQGVMLLAQGGNRSMGMTASNQTKVIKCYNCRDEGHMARQCSQPKRPRNSEWFKEKMFLVQAQESGVVLDEEQLSFLADPRGVLGPDTQITLPINVSF
ncbi:retrovirus-related pol polyprotein from transposon TNT 1-94 [Tanacetum coccineum]